MAPPGHHAAYTLIPVPNLKEISIGRSKDRLTDKVLEFLDTEGTCQSEGNWYKSFVDPRYLRGTLNSYLGNDLCGADPCTNGLFSSTQSV